MPNLRGGKSYKKTKGSSRVPGDDVVFIDKQSDQMVGRIVRLLGDLNTHVFCEDNKQRICKISTGIKKKIRFDVGDIVLLSTRDCDVSTAEKDKGKRGERGDILARYHPEQYSQLKQDGIIASMFLDIDKVNEISKLVADGDVDAAQKVADAADDDIFDRSGQAEEVVEKEVDVDAL